MMGNKTILEQLAQFTYEFQLDRADLESKATLCIMDALECCMAGTNQDARTLWAYEYVRSSAGPAVLFVRPERVRCEQAAFYNTVTGSVSSRNDISKNGSCHPGAIVVPVVLALSAEHSCSGQRLMEAVVCGYETMIRLGIALKQAGINKSFRSTALVAPFGAAFAAAKIMGLDAEQTCSAASLACHNAGGVNNWAVEGTGEDVFQNAWGDRNGLEACRLAAAGVYASRSVLEGSNGLLTAFGAQEQAHWITDGLGGHFHMLEVEHKPMGSCFKLQAPCQAAQYIVKCNSFRLKDVRQITIGLSDHALHHAGTDNIHIGSTVQAIMSIPFGVSSVLALGSCQSIRWEPPYASMVEQLMPLCCLKEREEWTQCFPGRHGADVTVVLADGRTLHAEQHDVDCLSGQQLAERFHTTAIRVLGQRRAAIVETMITSLMQLEYADQLCEALASPPAKGAVHSLVIS